MRVSKFLKVIFVVMLSISTAAFIGCGGRDSGSTDGGKDGNTNTDGSDGNNGTDNNNPGGLTICDIQNLKSPNHPSEGQTVALEGVVITSPIDVYNSNSSFFVGQPGGCGADGGKYSGIYIYGKKMTITASMGDQVSIKGAYTEYKGTADLRSLSEITIDAAAGGEFKVTGKGTPPSPTVVTPTQICMTGGQACATGTSTVCAGGTDADVYEGAVVELDNVTIKNASAPGSDCKPHGDWTVVASGSNDEIFISERFGDNFIYNPVKNATLKKLIGVLDYSYTQFRVQPRSCDDLIGADDKTVCPDCPAIGSAVRISQVQNPDAAGHVADGCKIKLENVVVTSAVVPASKSFYVADAAGGEWSGIYIYLSKTNTIDVTNVKPGKTVTIEGAISEYYGLTEIAATAVTVTGDGTIPDPVTVTVDEIKTDGTKMENYQGVLVKVTGVRVTDATYLDSKNLDHGDFLVAPSGDLANKLVVGWQFQYPYACGKDVTGKTCTSPTDDQRTVGDVFTSITGIMDFSFSDARLQPRDAADMIKQ